MEKDRELHTFASGTRHFEEPSRTTLPEALQTLKKGLRGLPYRRTQQQLDDGKKLSNRIMGERDE